MGRLGAAVAIAATLIASAAEGADLGAATAGAYAAYVEQAQRAFLSRIAAGPSLPAADAPTVGPAREDGIIAVNGGLIHHWRGRTYLRNVSLRDVIAVTQAYDSYNRVYRSIVSSSLLARDGDTYRVRVRLKESEAGLSAVLDVWSTVRYSYPGDGVVAAISLSNDIRQVSDPGGPHEQLLPAGTGNGYLWRAATFTAFFQRQDGVIVETETIGLSRPFPPLLGWFIEPIARRLGRKSVETSLQELTAATKPPPTGHGAGS
jgi:hypothetical protein